MGLFSRKKDGKSKKKGSQDNGDQQPAKPKWTDGWARPSVEPEEVHELVTGCTVEIKKRGMSSRNPLRGEGPTPSRICKLPFVLCHLGPRLRVAYHTVLI